MKKISSLIIFIACLVQASQGATKTSNGTGNWTAIAWTGGLPVAGDDVIIKSGNSVTFDAGGLLTINSLTVNGTLLFGSGAVVRNLIVTTNVSVTTTGNLSANTTFANTLSIGGNLSNANILNLSTGGKTLDLIFTNNGNASISGTGGTNTFHMITLNMGASNTNVLNVTSTKFVDALVGFLTLSNGTFELSSTTATTVTPFTGNVTIGPTCGLIINSATATVSTTAGNITLAGLITLNLGILNIGNAVNNSLLSNGGTLTVAGGTLNVAGAYAEAGAGIALFSMSGGIMNIAKNGATTTAGIAPFQLSNAGSSFAISAGTIIIENSGAGNLGYTNTVSSYTVTGGTIQIGLAGSPATASTFLINSSVTIPSLFINNLNATATLSTAITVLGNITLTAGKLNSNNLNITLSGNWTHTAAATWTPGTGTVTFNGSAAETISITTGTEIFNSLVINGTSTKTLGSAVTVNSDLSIGTGATLDVAAANYLMTIGGNWTDAGTFTPRTGTVTFNGASAQTITRAAGETFSTLSLTGNGTKTLGGPITTSIALSIGVGSTLDVSASNYAVTVTGTWTDNGTFIPLSGTVTFNKAGAQTIAKAGGETFYNLSLTAGNTKTLGSAVTLNGSLSIAAATTFDVSATNYAVNVAGNWTDLGTFTPRAGTVTFNGTSSQILTKTAGEIFDILSISGTGGVVLGGAITTSASLTIGSGSSLDVSSTNYAVAVKTGWINNGTFNGHAGTVTFSGAAAQTIGGTSTTTFYNLTQSNAAGVSITTAQNLAGTLTLTAGNFTTTGQIFTILSTAAHTGRITSLPAASNIVGNINMQRYVQPGATGWYFLGAPISAGLTLQSWVNSFVTSGFTGSGYPSYSFVSIYSYTESVAGNLSNGYVAATNSTNPIPIGKGFWCYLGPAPITINAVSGTPKMHNFTFPVTFTASGGPLNDGWNLVANPYPSSIDWNNAAWTKTNVSGQIQIWNPNTSTYASWVGGVGVNGGSNILASSQAFWVQTTAAAPVLSITEACKSATDIAFMRTSAGQNQNVLKLKISGNGYSDETAIYLNDNATVHYDAQYDAAKFFSLNTAVPSLSSVVDTIDLSINCIPALNASTVIPLRALIGTGASGTYTISMDTLQNMAVSSCLILEDKLTGTMTDLRAGGSYSFSIGDTTHAPRFLIHIGASISKQAVATRCSASKDGIAIAHGIGTMPCSYIWKNAKDSVLKTDNNMTGNDTLSGIGAGIYKVTITGNTGACAIVNDTVAVGSPAPTTAFGYVTNVTCRNNKDGAISITAMGGTAPYTYSWSVPGGSSSQNQTGLDTGSYLLALTDANQCAVTDTFVVHNGSNLQVHFVTSQDTTYLSAGGQVTFTNTSSGSGSFVWNFGDSSPADSTSSITHAYTASGNFTVTLTGLDGSCADSVKHVIVVMPQVAGIHDAALPVQSVQINSENGNWVVDFNLSETSNAVISVYDAQGRQVMNDLPVQAFQNKVQLPLGSLAQGIYLIEVNLNGKLFSRKIIR